MELEHTFNFNNPVEVTVIFRIPSDAGGRPKEFAGKASFLWEDVKCMEEYAHSDDWEGYKGDKFWIQLHNETTGKLVLGNYDSMTSHWRHFRNKYPIFVDRQEDNKEED